VQVRERATRAGTAEPPAIRSRRPTQRWAVAALLAVLSLGGFVGGVSFVRDPSGAGLGAELSWLDRTPVGDFLLPGLFLLVVYGIGGGLLAIGTIRTFSPGPLGWLDRRLGRRWAWVGTIAVGVILVLWILYELVVLPEQMWLQPALLVVGSLLVGISLTPAMRRDAEVPAAAGTRRAR
jgi:hypothetical protein